MHNIDLDQSHTGFINEIIQTETRSMIVLKPGPNDSDEKAAEFLFTNEIVDTLLALGFIEDITGDLTPPPGYPNEFRIVHLTDMGLTLAKGTFD